MSQTRLSFLDFTIRGDDLDPVAVKEAVGLPCEIYHKDQLVETKKSGRKIISPSTCWLYTADSKGTVDNFLSKHLSIISKKLDKLEGYIKNYDTILELIIYEDDAKKEWFTLSPKTLNLLAKIGVKFFVVFKNLENIYGKEFLDKVMRKYSEKNPETN